MFVPEILQENLQEEMMSNATATITWSKKRRCGMGAEVAGVCAIVLTCRHQLHYGGRRGMPTVKRKFTKFCTISSAGSAVLLKNRVGTLVHALRKRHVW